MSQIFLTHEKPYNEEHYDLYLKIIPFCKSVVKFVTIISEIVIVQFLLILIAPYDLNMNLYIF